MRKGLRGLVTRTGQAQFSSSWVPNNDFFSSRRALIALRTSETSFGLCCMIDHPRSTYSTFSHGREEGKRAYSTAVKVDQTEKTDSKAAPHTGEIKNAQIVFDAAWNKLTTKYLLSDMIFPKEIIWLMGAPGSGKGTNTPFITQARGIVSKPVVLSSLLDDASDLRKIKEEGGMISDTLVVEKLFETLLQEQYRIGALVDGFPRTEIQVEIITLLYNRMLSLKQQFPQRFPRPVFRMAVLYVDEQVSIERQLARGRHAKDHNEKVRQTGIGALLEVRATDQSEQAAGKRYTIFKEHFETLTSLQKRFPFHLINAMGSIDDVRQRILKQFEYQSSLELEEATFDSVQRIPLAQTIAVHARQHLIKRLDDYQNYNKETFHKVITIIEQEFLPDVKQHAISGACLIRSENPIFEHEEAVRMALDVLSERGYTVSFDQKLERVPERVDTKTFEIVSAVTPKYYFYVKFPQAVIRQTARDAEFIS